MNATMIEGTAALVRPVEVGQSSTFHPLRNWPNARLVLKEEFAAQGIIWVGSAARRVDFQLLLLSSATANWHCLEFPRET